MKVKCINLYCDKTNRDMAFALTLGKEYLVLEMQIYSDGSCYRLVDDDEDGRPAIYSSLLFEVTDGRIPSNWVIEQMRINRFTLSPKKWHGTDFWLNFYEWDPEAVAIFNEEVTIIFDEADASEAN